MYLKKALNPNKKVMVVEILQMNKYKKNKKILNNLVKISNLLNKKKHRQKMADLMIVLFYYLFFKKY